MFEELCQHLEQRDQPGASGKKKKIILFCPLVGWEQFQGCFRPSRQPEIMSQKREVRRSHRQQTG